MTDARSDVPVDRDAAPTGSGSGHADSPENVPVSPDQDYPAAIAGNFAPGAGAGHDLTEDVQADSAQRTPASAECGEAAQTDPAEAVQDDPDRTDPDFLQADSANAVPPSDLQVEPDQDDPVLVGPTADTNPTGDPARNGQVEPDRADPLGSIANSTGGDPAAPVAAAPPLRDPDEAALRLAEAAVLASATPMTPRALSQILPDDLDPAAVIGALRARYEGRGFELCEIGGGLQFRTAADLAPHLRKVVQVPRRLPRVALETLAIVAYHQPITRPEIEDLRGTGLSQQTLDVLLENDLIVARGRKETPGRPTLWGTTVKFLEYFGLRDIRELPRRQDLLLEAVRPETAAESVPPEGV